MDLGSKRAVILVGLPVAEKATGETVGRTKLERTARCGPSDVPYDVAPSMALDLGNSDRRQRTRSSSAQSCGRLRRAGLAVVGALIVGAAGLACRCTDTARAYAHTRDDSPVAAIERFVLYWKAGLHDLEYGCFSRGFKQRHQISLQAYDVGRSQLEREQPWLAWFAQAQVVGEQARGRSAHVLWLDVAGRTVRVNLVREETARIWSGDELLAEQSLELDRALAIEPSGAVRLELEPDTYRPFESFDVTSVRAERAWRIDDFAEVPRDSVPAPQAP